MRRDDQGGVREMSTDFRPHEIIQGVRPKISLRAAPDRAACTQDIVTGAVIVMVPRAVTPTHPMARHAEVAHATTDHASEQVVPRLEMTRTEPAVIEMNRLRALKELVVNEGRHRQGNPLRCRPTSGPTLDLTSPRTGLRITGERFVAAGGNKTDGRPVV